MKQYFSNFHFFLLLIFSLIIHSNSNSIFDYSHANGESLSIQAGSLSSRRYIIPFGYTRLNICQSKKIIKTEDTLGEILTGESYYTTGYIANTNIDKYCQVLCYNTFSEKNEKIYKKLIRRRYFSNWIVDKLPAGLIMYNKETRQTSLSYFDGIPLGFVADGQFYIYNHLQFHILLNKIDDNRYNVVGFNILPMSIKHDNEKPKCVSEAKEILKNLGMAPQPLQEGNILFTYDVVYEYSDIPFASRWDHYKTKNVSIHWTGIVISEFLVIIASVFIIYIFKKNVNIDIDSYNYRVSQIEEIFENDWKQVAGDVFRPPAVNTLLLSSILGTGTQLLAMFSITLLLGVLGFMNPEKRSNILNIGILFYCFCGLFAGYVAANFYRFWKGESWIRVAVFTSLLFPGTLVLGYSIVNIVLTIEKSNAAVNFSDIASLFFLWLFCTFPLILIGSFFGYKTNQINIPFNINKIPSIIPPKPWYLHYRYITFLTGLIGFATIFIEFNYVMAALWRHQIYFLATFLWISFLLFIIVVGEMTILVVYYNLCYGDYNWWWKSFIIGSSPVIYFIIYSIIYFFYLKITRLSAMIVYFGLMGMISAMVIFICGTVSVFFSMGFLNRIYSKIRID
jgi:transmembrane 9 superfamily protein 2/4